MNRLFTLLLCILLCLSLCACNSSDNGDIADTTDAVSTESTEQQASSSELNEKASAIIGTYICKDINKDCYFIFDEKGDAYAKWGTSTVYGYYDYNADEDLFDIDLSGFFYNEYELKSKDDGITLTSDSSFYELEKAKMPEVTIDAPKNLKSDKDILGDWQSADTYECYRFNDDNTAVITDMYNYATIDCKYSCDNGVVTLYYMASDTTPGNREVEYNLTKDDKLVLGEYTYDKVQQNN